MNLISSISTDAFFNFIEYVLPNDIAIDILLSLVNSGSNSVRDRCCGARKPSLFSSMIQCLCTSTMESSSSQVAELIRLILEQQQQQPQHHDIFVTKFYEGEYLEDIVSPLIDPPPSLNATMTAFNMQMIFDILSFCVCSHSTYLLAKSHFLQFNSLYKSMRSILIGGYRFRSKFLQLSVIRLVRSFIWQKDPLYFRCLTAYNIPGLILQLLYQNRPDGLLIDGSMIYSASLEILTFICVNNQIGVMESLCKHESESARLVVILAAEEINKAHSELCRFMLMTVERFRSSTASFDCVVSVDDSRQSITSSRARSVSPSRPMIVPVPQRRRMLVGDEDDDEGDVPTTPQTSPFQECKRIRFSTSP